MPKFTAHPPTPSAFSDAWLDMPDVAGYRPLRLLGSGTYGCVLDAECKTKRARVALVSPGGEVGGAAPRGVAPPPLP